MGIYFVVWPQMRPNNKINTHKTPAVCVVTEFLCIFVSSKPFCYQTDSFSPPPTLNFIATHTNKDAYAISK
jgi:hypothetical protein